LGEHAGTDVDPHDPAALGIERHVAAGSDAGIQYGSGQAIKQQRPQRPVTASFKPGVEQIIEARDTIVCRPSGGPWTLLKKVETSCDKF
jgi:hypothetical protein